jgi:hypothetical protein
VIANENTSSVQLFFQSVSKVAANNLPNSLQSLSMKAFTPKTYESGNHYVVRVRRRVRIPPLPRIGYRHRRRVERDVTSIDDGQLSTASENSPMSYQIQMPTLHNHMTTNDGDARTSLSFARQFLVNEQNRLLGPAKWTRAAPLPRIGRRLVDNGSSAFFSEETLAAPLESEQQDDRETSAINDALSATRRAMPLPRIGLEARAAPLPRIGLRAAAAAVAKRILLRPMLEASRRAAPLPRIGWS